MLNLSSMIPNLLKSCSLGGFSTAWTPFLLHPQPCASFPPRQIFFFSSPFLIFLRFSPYLGKGFVVFQRNKELLIGVGRRDFELGSAPAFPAVRVEIDWGRMAHNAQPVPLRAKRHTIFQKKKKKVFKRFPSPWPLFERPESCVLC